jgi:hypothetical protein
MLFKECYGESLGFLLVYEEEIGYDYDCVLRDNCPSFWEQGSEGFIWLYD